MKYNFLCQIPYGYWIFEDREYQVNGKKEKFKELSSEQKNNLAVAIVNNGHDATLIVNALNLYCNTSQNK
jgi:hypothetical protein